jgi:hypothetical protein
MDNDTQEAISRLVVEQSAKLGAALRALRKISKLKTNEPLSVIEDAIEISNNTLREIAEYGKNPQDL